MIKKFQPVSILFLALVSISFGWFLFPTVTHAAWYSSSWGYRVPITVQATQVPANLTNFPIYVNLNNLPAGFHTNVKEDGGDIRVTTSDGSTEVPREIVWYATSTDTGEMHFKAPSVSSTTDTVFYIYYGNASASEPAVDATYGSENVWSDYDGVWHFQEDPSVSTTIDSTASGWDLTTVGTVTATTSPLGGAANDNGSANANQLYRNIADTSYPTFSLTFVGKINAVQDDGRASIVSNADNTNPGSFQIQSSSGNWSFRYEEIDPPFGAQSTNFTWQTVTSDGLDRNLYYQGAFATTIATTTASNFYVIKALTNRRANQAFNGAITELRLTSSVMSPDWVAAEYTNQNTPGTFYNAGTQEEVPAEGASAIGLRFKSMLRFIGQWRFR